MRERKGEKRKGKGTEELCRTKETEGSSSGELRKFQNAHGCPTTVAKEELRGTESKRQHGQQWLADPHGNSAPLHVPWESLSNPADVSQGKSEVRRGRLPGAPSPAP